MKQIYFFYSIQKLLTNFVGLLTLEAENYLSKFKILTDVDKVYKSNKINILHCELWFITCC